MRTVAIVTLFTLCLGPPLFASTDTCTDGAQAFLANDLEKLRAPYLGLHLRLDVAMTLILPVLADAAKPGRNDEPHLEHRPSWEETRFPDDSPYWWTLSDDLGPAEFRAKVHRAIHGIEEDGIARDRMKSLKKQGESLTLVLDGKADPELFLLWEALAAFGKLYRSDPLAIQRELEGASISSTGAELVAEGLARWQRDWTAMSEDLIAAHEKLLELRSLAEERHGKETVDQVWRANDLLKLAELVRWEQEKLNALVESATRPVDAEAMIPISKSLRDGMTYRDWIHLRFFLREEIARNSVTYAVNSAAFRAELGSKKKRVPAHAHQPAQGHPNQEPRLYPRVFWEQTGYPDDSPYWWTLSDDVTPAELRSKANAAHSRARELARSAASPADREVAVPILDGSEDPDVFPMWYVFARHALHYGPERADAIKHDLVRAGISSSGTAVILQGLREWWSRKGALHQEVVPAQRRLEELRELTASTRGEEAAQEVWRRNDIQRLARLVDVDVHELHRLASHASRDVAAEAMLPVLRSIHEQITCKDWGLLRGFLRNDAASTITVFGTIPLSELSAQEQEPEEPRP